MTYPVVEYGQIDPLLQREAPPSPASSSIAADAIPQLANLVMFGDNPSGEVFYFSADKLPRGGQDPIRRVLFNDNGAAKTLLQTDQGEERGAGQDAGDARGPALRHRAERQVFLLNKRDGTIRLLAR